MMLKKRPSKRYMVALIWPLLIGLAVAMAMPQAAFATFGDDGDRGGQGDRPERRNLTTYELLRLNDDALLDITIGPQRIYLTIDGPMGVYSSNDVVNAIYYQRERAGRLIERLERARTDEEKKEIISGLQKAAEKRFKASEKKLNKEKKILGEAGLLRVYPDILAPPEIRNNPRVQAYYALLRATYAEERYAEMLSRMLSVHTGQRRLFFNLLGE